MTVTIRSTGSKSISVNQGASTQSGIIVKKQEVAPKLESITNVSAVDLSNGDTLIYNATSQKWEARPLTVEVGASIDGGTY